MSTSSPNQSYGKYFIFFMVWMGSMLGTPAKVSGNLTGNAIRQPLHACAAKAMSAFFVVLERHLKRNARGNKVFELTEKQFVRRPMATGPVRTYWGRLRFRIAPCREIIARARSDPVPVTV